MSEGRNNKIIKAGPMEIFIMVSLSYLLLIIFVFSDILFSSSNLILSSRTTDLYQQYIHWRNFGFGEMSDGNIALWNPHIFSGAPFVGGFQSALFYPPNLVYCALPLADAVNWSIIINLTIAGICMFYWTRYHNIHFVASYFAGLLFIFCAPQFLHIYAGHLSNLCTMAWVPLLMLAIDGIANNSNKPDKDFSKSNLIQWTVLGAGTVALQILAGHPQYVYYTAISAATYCIIKLRDHSQKKVFLLCFIGIYIASIFLSAVQLFPGISSYLEGTRGGDIPIQFTGMFSFPPENLITLIMPDFLGSFKNYWGRWFLWEMSLFFTVSALIMSIAAILYSKQKLKWQAVIMIVALFILALGKYTPLYTLLYNFVPGFDTFRGSSKFILPLSVFAILLSAMGMDYIFKKQSFHSRIPAGIFLTLSALAFVLLLLFNMELCLLPGETYWGNAILNINQTKETYLQSTIANNPDFQKRAAEILIDNAVLAIGVFIAIATVFTLMRYNKNASYAIVLIMLFEMIYFAKSNTEYFNLDESVPYSLEEFYSSNEDKHRVLYSDNNLGMTLNGYDIWGLDASTPKRYAEFITFLMGLNPDDTTKSINFNHQNIKVSNSLELVSMLRCKYLISQSQNELQARTLKLAPAKQAMIVHNYLRIKERNKIFGTMASPKFKYKDLVILEEEPNIMPDPLVGKETVKIIKQSTDHMLLSAELLSDGILFITESFDSNWKAYKVEDGSKTELSLMPANYIYRAVPLRKGKHKVLLEYSPTSYSTGKWISIASIILCITGIVNCRKNKMGKRDEK